MDLVSKFQMLFCNSYFTQNSRFFHFLALEGWDDFTYKDDLFFSFFWLDPKEPKGQAAATLQPHGAGRWPAAASAHRALPVLFSARNVSTPTILP
jgi:hypothetical protein